MARSARQHALELFERLLYPAKLQQRHAAAIAQVRIVGRETQARLETRQCPREIFQRVEHKSQAGEAVGAVGVDFERLLNERQRGIRPPTAQLNSAKPMQRVETVRPLRQRRVVEPLGLFQLGRFVRALRTANEARYVLRHKRLRVHSGCPSAAAKPLTSGKQTW